MDVVARCSPVGYSLYDFPITSAAAWAALGGASRGGRPVLRASGSLSTLARMAEIAGTHGRFVRRAHARARGAGALTARRSVVRDAWRERPEDECAVRTPFSGDRDRIVHSKAFRRLKGKTQVFIDPVRDHYRTRMTHTLETSAISRVVARR